MKFLADMGISSKTVMFLRRLGHDAIHLNDEGLHRAPDGENLEKAEREERILLAHDLDLADLMATSGARLPSVIIFRRRKMSPDRVNHSVQLVIMNHSASPEAGPIISVTEARIRVRSLSVQDI